MNSLKRNIEGEAVAFHSSLYVNGTECDITGKPRRTVARVRSSVVIVLTEKLYLLQAQYKFTEV